MYKPVESAALSIYMEDRTRDRGGLHGRRQTIGSDPDEAYLLSKLCMEAGLPAGVLNIVNGLGPKVGSAIVAHRDVKAISFTGGTKTGEEIARIAAPMFKKLSLELGARIRTSSLLTAITKKCLPRRGVRPLPIRARSACAVRVYLSSVRFTRGSKRICGRRRTPQGGDPLDADTDVGAIVSKQHFDKIMSYIELAKAEGGTILTGGLSLDLTAETQSTRR